MSGFRLIPPPRVGRWTVWKVSHYPAGGRIPVGRYRLGHVAWLIAWSLNRQRMTRMHHFEVHPRGRRPAVWQQIRLYRRTEESA